MLWSWNFYQIVFVVQLPVFRNIGLVEVMRKKKSGGHLRGDVQTNRRVFPTPDLSSSHIKEASPWKNASAV